jgi:2-polyprenyl-6-methoxyphenol hydroxylase-like FAD-dependent oxidoreductase
MLAVSRPLLEWYLRRRLLTDPRVEVLPGTSVLDLTLDPGLGRVDGVIVKHLDHLAPARLAAELVVDASGRTSRLPEWLDRRGLSTPPEDVRRADRYYATRTFRRRADRRQPLAVVVAGAPKMPRGAVMIAQEGDRWTVSLAGGREDQPPADLAGFKAFTQNLSSPILAELVQDLEPLDDGMTYRFPVNRRRHYEMLSDLPEGLLVTGDAFCAFNPVYGQGMTVAALEAHTLAECLLEGGPALARRYHQRAARHQDTPWAIAVDEGPRPGDASSLRTRLANAYLQQVIARGADDPDLAAAFLRVNHLVDRTEDLLQPRVVWRVARAALRHRPRGRARARGGRIRSSDVHPAQEL